MAGGGCITGSRTAPRPAPGQFTLSLPSVPLLPGEYLQQVEVEVRHGRVVSVNRLLDDWDAQVTWDNPELVTVSCQARHFSAGLADTKALTEFLTVESSGNLPMAITATVHTSSCDPAERPDRVLTVGESELALRPVSSGDKVR